MTSIAGLAPSPSRASTRKAGIDLQLHKHVLHVWSVDGRGESFCAECSIECRWACPPGEVDAALADGLDQLDADWEPEWTPQIGFWGTVEVLHERRLFWAEEDETTGSVWLRGRVRLAVKVIERFDLRSFPFDVQDMNLLLVVYNVREWIGPGSKVTAPARRHSHRHRAAVGRGRLAGADGRRVGAQPRRVRPARF